MRRFPFLAGPLFVAGCVAAPPPAPAPSPAPLRVTSGPAPAPLRGADWRDWPLTPGTWSYARDARGSVALFGVPGSDAALVLRCDVAGRRVYLSRAGTVLSPLTIRTSSLTRAIAVQPTGGQPAYVASPIAAGDPVLDAIGFSRGRFVVDQAGLPSLVVPAWAEIERVTEDCRG